MKNDVDAPITHEQQLVAEIERLRAQLLACEIVLADAETERDMGNYEVKRLRAAVPAAPPQANDRLTWAIAGAREMQITIADGPCWSDEDRPYILELDPVEVARRAVDAEGG